MKDSRRRAFTLVELLIASAIISILALVALPNFLEAQARSKVARVHNDIRVLHGALAAYQVDNQAYPAAAIGDLMVNRPLDVLTSPVAYITTVPEDPFTPARMDFSPAIWLMGYQYKDAVSTSQGMPAETYGYVWEEVPDREYMLHSCGPNKVWDVTPYVDYDPTNGTVSHGDICSFGPM